MRELNADKRKFLVQFVDNTLKKTYDTEWRIGTNHDSKRHEDLVGHVKRDVVNRHSNLIKTGERIR